jgi:type III secretory pathway component EscU
LFEDEILKNKFIKKSIEDVQKYLKETKGNEDIEHKINDIMKNVQNQKVQITVKKKSTGINISG